MRKLLILFFAVITLSLIFSCANRGMGPQGGPRDVTPPQVVRYSPADGSTHMQRKRIEITFDEIVVLKNPSQKVVVSPPQRTPAEIKAVSHKIIIEFADTLLDSTTYSIDFTDAIVDNNEGNKLDGFTYCFSTGDYLDSLQIAGRVISAANLNPAVGILVGVHPENHDSVFRTNPFSRISKTNERGEFVIRNLPPGRYSVFALSDIGGNFMKDMPGEEIAFLDTIFSPSRTITLTYDTIRALHGDSLVDSVVTHRHVVNAPENIILRSFVEQDNRRYLVKVLRPDRHRLQMLFAGSDTVAPTITPLNFPDSLFSHIVTANAPSDTVNFWLRDTALWRQDTLQCLLAYSHRDFDSIYARTDTVSFIFRHANSAKKGTPRKSISSSASKKSKNKSDNKNQVPKLATSNASPKFDVYRPLEIYFTMPTELRPHDDVTFHLQVKEDTLWHDIPDVTLDRANGGTTYLLRHKWEPTLDYRIILDSSLFVNMIGQTNGLETFNLTVKSLEEYSKLIIHLTDVTGNEVVQLLNGKDQVVRQIPLTDSTAVGTSRSRHDVIFDHITPGVYYMRLFTDDNGDRLWTPGLYTTHRQPEEVVYFPYDIELRAFWDVEEDWSPRSTVLAKPRELIPEPDKEKK